MAPESRTPAKNPVDLDKVRKILSSTSVRRLNRALEKHGHMTLRLSGNQTVIMRVETREGSSLRGVTGNCAELLLNDTVQRDGPSTWTVPAPGKGSFKVRLKPSPLPERTRIAEPGSEKGSPASRTYAEVLRSPKPSSGSGSSSGEEASGRSSSHDQESGQGATDPLSDGNSAAAGIARRASPRNHLSTIRIAAEDRAQSRSQHPTSSDESDSDLGDSDSGNSEIRGRAPDSGVVTLKSKKRRRRASSSSDESDDSSISEAVSKENQPKRRSRARSLLPERHRRADTDVSAAAASCAAPRHTQRRERLDDRTGFHRRGRGRRGTDAHDHDGSASASPEHHRHNSSRSRRRRHETRGADEYHRDGSVGSSSRSHSLRSGRSGGSSRRHGRHRRLRPSHADRPADLESSSSSSVSHLLSSLASRHGGRDRRRRRRSPSSSTSSSDSSSDLASSESSHRRRKHDHSRRSRSPHERRCSRPRHESSTARAAKRGRSGSARSTELSPRRTKRLTVEGEYARDVRKLRDLGEELRRLTDAENMDAMAEYRNPPLTTGIDAIRRMPADACIGGAPASELIEEVRQGFLTIVGFSVAINEVPGAPRIAPVEVMSAVAAIQGLNGHPIRLPPGSGFVTAALIRRGLCSEAKPLDDKMSDAQLLKAFTVDPGRDGCSLRRNLDFAVRDIRLGIGSVLYKKKSVESSKMVRLDEVDARNALVAAGAALYALNRAKWELMGASSATTEDAIRLTLLHTMLSASTNNTIEWTMPPVRFKEWAVYEGLISLRTRHEPRTDARSGWPPRGKRGRFNTNRKSDNEGPLDSTKSSGKPKNARKSPNKGRAQPDKASS